MTIIFTVLWILLGQLGLICLMKFSNYNMSKLQHGSLLEIFMISLLGPILLVSYAILLIVDYFKNRG